MRRVWRPVILAASLVTVPGCFFLLLMMPKTTAAALPDRPGKDVYVRRCSTCHALIEPTAFRAKLGEIVNRYRDQKIITTSEQTALTEYLATFPDARGRALAPPTPTPTPEATPTPEPNAATAPPETPTATPEPPAAPDDTEPAPTEGPDEPTPLEAS